MPLDEPTGNREFPTSVLFNIYQDAGVKQDSNKYIFIKHLNGTLPTDPKVAIELLDTEGSGRFLRTYDQICTQTSVYNTTYLVDESEPRV